MESNGKSESCLLFEFDSDFCEVWMNGIRPLINRIYTKKEIDNERTRLEKSKDKTAGSRFWDNRYVGDCF